MNDDTMEVDNLDDLPDEVKKEITEWGELIRRQITTCDSNHPNQPTYISWPNVCTLLALYKYQLETLSEHVTGLAERYASLAETAKALAVKLNEVSGKDDSDDWWKNG